MRRVVHRSEGEVVGREVDFTIIFPLGNSSGVLSPPDEWSGKVSGLSSGLTVSGVCPT